MRGTVALGRWQVRPQTAFPDGSAQRRKPSSPSGQGLPRGAGRPGRTRAPSGGQGSACILRVSSQKRGFRTCPSSHGVLVTSSFCVRCAERRSHGRERKSRMVAQRRQGSGTRGMGPQGRILWLAAAMLCFGTLSRCAPVVPVLARKVLVRLPGRRCRFRPLQTVEHSETSAERNPKGAKMGTVTVFRRATCAEFGASSPRRPSRKCGPSRARAGRRRRLSSCAGSTCWPTNPRPPDRVAPCRRHRRTDSGSCNLTGSSSRSGRCHTDTHDSPCSARQAS